MGARYKQILIERENFDIARERQTYRQADRQTDRQTNRQTDIELTE